MGSYLFEHGWDSERRRLDLLEEVFDPGTQACLSRLPVPPGGRCLEVGAGAGSIARWLCDRVGPAGRVVATDLDTGFLETLAEENLEVRRHDIVADELETGAFDLVHARLVIEHLPQRDDVLRRLAGALRPGGWLVLEDFDWSSLVAAPRCTGGDTLARAFEALHLVFGAAEASTDYGRRLPLDFRAAGLVEVGAEGRVHVGLGGTPAASWWQLTLAKLGPPMVATGLVTDADVDDLLRSCDDPGYCVLFPTLVSAWGRRE